MWMILSCLIHLGELNCLMLQDFKIRYFRFNMISSSDFHDQPPSYVDVLRTNRLGAEPPPPYQSQEAINATNISERENP